MREGAPGRWAGPLWAVTRPGPGRPLVLLHGNGESHRVFDRLVRELPGRRLVGLDSRAHGRSPRGHGPLSIASMADDVAGALAALGLTDVDLLGYSDGGNIGLELAIRRPDLLHALAVCGANLDPQGLRPLALASTVAVHRVLAGAARAVPMLHGPSERLALMTEHPQIAPEALAQIRLPVLVVAGERDAVRHEHTALIAASLPDARLVVLPGAGHRIPTTRPAQLAGLVR
ncbi:alpha/beta fold hydrolase, partial [Cellulomonas citrea]|uniref:alpha/beta fold hydrolase n=1 Tax=Cellulomonas citrea TaxID=1909423 RepID=UPI0013592650